MWLTYLQIPPSCTAKEWQWLNYTDSLTAQLRLLTQDQISLDLIKSSWEQAYAEESALLSKHIELKRTWIREIFHVYQSQPWIWGRVIIPEQTIQLTGLKADGHQPIGDILFQDPSLKRTKLSFALLNSDHPYHQSAANKHSSESNFWGRRSIFWFHHQPLLIVEVFLPAFFNYVENETHISDRHSGESRNPETV